jgi:hypothetical protein
VSVITALLVVALHAQLGQIQVPQPVGYVNDFARVIDAGAAARIESIIQQVRERSGGEIVVVTLSDLRGREPSDVAREIGRQWKVGQQGGPGDRARNTGVIILVVPKETSPDGRGHTRIEVGTGAEGFLTDAQTGRMQDAALPYLRERDYASGILLMTSRVAERFATEFGFQLDSNAIIRAPPGDVVPRESPASWADQGGGAGLNALKAQAVAARSYAWAENRNPPLYKTCDTTACQVYGGAGLNGVRIEDARTDKAIADTAGEVRLLNGSVARTEFSSSTGGWTAGGTFPAVEDTGDVRLRRVTQSLSHFIPQLALPKRFGTARADALLGYPAPPVSAYWGRMVARLLAAAGGGGGGGARRAAA